VGVALAFLAGAVLGAFLPWPSYRLSVGFDEPARTKCHHCGQSLRLAWRCPACGTRWGPPWWVTALVAGSASALIAFARGRDPALPLFVALAGLGTMLGAIDLACQRLPTTVVTPAIAVSAVLLLVPAGLTGSWSSYGRAVVGAGALGLVYLLLYLIPGGGLGFGDVRLGVLLGLYLGWLGWPAVIGGALLPWLVNGPVIVVLLLARRIGRKSRVPFGPAMLVGALLAILFLSPG
jgi:leader peptidase (prepilin peptidase)/N-methyltransferase